MAEPLLNRGRNCRLNRNCTAAKFQLYVTLSFTPSKKPAHAGFFLRQFFAAFRAAASRADDQVLMIRCR